MDPNTLPTLEHGIPDPETYLPETPDWFWWFLIGGVALTVLAIWWLIHLLFEKPKNKKEIPERDLFSPAMKVLDSLESQADKRLVSEIAAEASLAIRTYLAGARSEPALYETVEEFQARQAVLPADANQVLNRLNDAKYNKSDVDQTRSAKLIEESRVCLTKLRQFTPVEDQKNDQMPVLPESKPAGWIQRTFARRTLAAFPFGLILALGGLLGGSYQRRGVGDEVQGNALVWVGLSISVVALVTFLIVRPSQKSS
ncbi:hypothetical protein OAE39_00915 [Akkermansiaceae bacterium]|nr:hypothetical protein [Akkermansiaceae bacterium]